jgi:ribosomal-protein-alanine N-acetyltransferase
VERSFRFVEVRFEVMSALVAGDVATASAELGVPITEHFLGDGLFRLWCYRVDIQGISPGRPQGRVWAVVSEPDGVIVGHGGFHAPPDDTGTIEIGYSVDAGFRRRGWAKAIVAELLRRAAEEGARTVRASIAPDNVASLATVAALGFHHVGEQHDEEDGRELLFERPVPSP